MITPSGRFALVSQLVVNVADRKPPNRAFHGAQMIE
jgi:hypothetical protein